MTKQSKGFDLHKISRVYINNTFALQRPNKKKLSNDIKYIKMALNLGKDFS